jgi:ADP-heptose:LPS heptosyltransferase
VKRLLVIRFSALGDVAMLVPVIHQLAITFPDWQVTILSRQQVSSLFDNMPTNVLFYGADLKGKHKGIKGLNRLLHDIHYEEFDAVADMHDVLRTKWICWRMKLNGMRVASIRKGRLEKWLLTHMHYR